MKKIFFAVALSLLWAFSANAQFNNCFPGFCPGGIFGGGLTPSAILPASMQSNPPDFYANLTTNQAYVKGLGYNPPATDYISVSRASTATQVDSSGNWSQFGSGVLARTNLGASIWEARTNSIRNNTMAGAVVMADGVEKIINGTFASSANWLVTQSGSSTVTFGSNQVSFVNDGVNLAAIDQQFTGLTVGKNYVVSAASPTASSVSILVGTSQGDASLLNNIVNSQTGQPKKFGFTATQTSLWLRLGRVSAGGPATITFISIQDGERVENGNFALNPINAAQNTVQNGWQWSLAGTATVTWNSVDTVTLTGDGVNSAVIDTSFPTASGFTYTLSVDTGAAAAIQIGTAKGGSTLLNTTSGSGANQKFQFTATGTATWLRFVKTSAVAATIKNISVQSAGALPTNWVQGTATGGLYRYITGVGTNSGINTVDIRVAGTTTDGAGWAMRFDAATAIAALYGQTWTGSFFASIVDGSTSGITTIISSVIQRNGAGSSLGQTTTSNLIGTLTSSLQKVALNFTLNNSATAFVQNDVTFGINSGATVDVTIRLGWPQLENNSLINSSVASAVKAADGTGGVDGTAVYSVGGGTCSTTPTLNVTWSTGVMTVNSVANAGSCSVLPPSPATLTYISGIATGWTGATVTLTPTDNSAKAAASNPILTSGTAATRNAEALLSSTVGLPAFSTSGTIWVSASPQTPPAYPVNRYGIMVSDGSNNNRANVNMLTPAGAAGFTYLFGGAVVVNRGVNGGAIVPSQNSIFKQSMSYTSTRQASSVNGSAVDSNSSAASPITPNQINLGFYLSGQQLNGNLGEYAIWFNQAVPDAQLQSMTQ